MSRGIPAAHIRLKRAYDDPEDSDGKRILVDRLWPRGVSKETARLDQWLKDIAPSDELREWFDHDPERWKEFERRYREELHGHRDMLAHLRDDARQKTVTFVYAAHDSRHNNAVALRKALLGRSVGTRSNG